ncbi:MULTISPECIES: GerMN domain-containing protein [Bacillaceae]|uniref:GerMN domain-containing protein n=1 Tax=Evansella alkalicola TaxID=745819 RepID=A0ABS6JYV4_9BACI|nr:MULTISPECIES: GerMN domain-containing protein [Bacillaceae]MBU9723774.1 GerMN domain-containing protein [Bacillus alkalicola]
MKKLTWLLLLGLSLLLVLAACGQGEGNDSTGGTDDTDSIVEDHQDETEVDEADEASEESSDEAQEDSAEDSSELADEEVTESDEEVAKVNNVEFYFSDDQVMDIYRVITDVSVTADEAGAMQVYELWIAGPLEENLVSLVPETTKVQSITFDGDVAKVSFSEDILDANLGSSGEAMLIDQITMLAHQFGYNKTQILIDGEVPDGFLGHMDVSEPFQAKNPSDFKTAE